MTLTIKNGHALLDGKLEKRNIVIEDGKIAAIGSGSSGETINAEGKIIMPGLIDIHVHLREPGLTHKEDIASGTRAAAAGGVTTIFDMPNTKPATTTIRLLQEKKELFRQKAIVNYGIYIGATTTNIEELKKAKNIPGVKLYMGSTTGEMAVTDDAAVERTLKSGRKIIVHAEDEILTQKNEEKYRKETAPEIHARIRSNEVASSATMKALSIGGDIHITHCSTQEEMKMIKAKGISCDVTPHHLFLTNDELKKQGNFAKMNPPLRSREDVAALWQAITDGTVSCIATDHAPHTIDEKEIYYWNAPAGVPGLETMLPLLLDAVNKKRLTLQRVAELTSANSALIFGVKNKGKIGVGYDADLVVIDMNRIAEVRNEELFTKCKWSPFNGWKLKGWPVATIVKGKLVHNDNEITGRNGSEVEFR